MTGIRRGLPWFMVLCMALLPIAGAGAADVGFLPLAVPVTEVSIDGPAQVGQGGQFSVDIAVDHVEDYNIANFDLVYDVSIITVTDVTDGEIAGYTVEVGPGNWNYIPLGPDDTGRIRVISEVPGAPGPGVTGSGYIARVHFQVLGPGDSHSDITLEGVAMYNHLAQAIATTTVDGSVYVLEQIQISGCGAAPNPTKVGYATQFSVNAAGGLEPYNYLWTFGDGSSSTAAAPTYTYGSAGTYAVTVTVTDDGGDTDDCSFDLVVNPPLSVSDCGADRDPTRVGYETAFGVTPSGGVGAYAYLWNFGDGSSSTEATPTHTYAVGDDGLYDVSVTVTDSLGNIQTCSFELLVRPPVTVSIEAPDLVMEGTTFVAFVAVDYVEDFNSVSFDVVYDQTIITVIDVTDGEVGGHTVVVEPADWNYVPPGGTDTGRTRVMAAMAGLPGPGVTGTGYVARIHFHVLGSVCNTSPIGLETLAMYNYGAKEIATTTVDGSVHVVDHIEISGCGAVPDPTKVGYATDFSVAASGGVEPYTYLWTFGDGSSSTDAAPNYTYSSADTYTVTVTVTDDEGDTDECSFELIVFPPLSVSSCGADRDPTRVGSETTFSVDASGGVGPYTYLWDFGDGSTSTAESPTHTYSTADTYAVSVTVTDSLSNIQTCAFELLVKPPVVVSIEAPSEVTEETTFVAVVALDYVMDFDSVSFDVTYDQTIITVTGVTGGEINGHTVPVGPGDWLFVPPGSDDTGTIRVITSMPGVPGPGVTGSGYLAEIHFQVLGSACSTSDIALEAVAMYDYQARSIPTTTLDGSVHVVAPLVVSGCGAVPDPTKVGYETSFSVSVSGGVEPYIYDWDFGDGTTSTDPAPTHVYAIGQDGNRSVTVSVTDSLGSVETCSFDLMVFPPLSVVGCGADPDPARVGYETSFGVTVSGGVAPYTYDWDFGDGNGSEAAAPDHVYTTPDTYTVSVTVTDVLSNIQTCSFELVVRPPLEITTGVLPQGEVGDGYYAELEAIGGAEPYTWTATGLPAGMTCSIDGVISGTPIGAVGDFTVTLTVNDAAANTDSRDLTLTVVCKPGDVNLDGVVNAGDITKVKRIFFGIDAPTPCADVNGDGVVNAGDITAIRAIFFGLMSD